MFFLYIHFPAPYFKDKEFLFIGKAYRNYMWCENVTTPLPSNVQICYLYISRWRHWSLSPPHYTLTSLPFLSCHQPWCSLRILQLQVTVAQRDHRKFTLCARRIMKWSVDTMQSVGDFVPSTCIDVDAHSFFFFFLFWRFW